jgi:molecular chaperone DnaK
MTTTVGHADVSTDTAADALMPTAQIVGIDYGTSYSAVARLDVDGVPRLLPDDEGRELVDSVLWFRNDGSVRVGYCDGACEDASMIAAVKRHLGERRYSLQHAGRKLSPELLSALILRKVTQGACRFGGLAGVILTVPSYFFAPGRKATRSAGQIADLPVIELLAEPIAAALSHLWQTDDGSLRDRSLLVFDLGGGTFDVTIVRVSNGRLEVVATEGDNALGGIDWTARLADFAAEKFRRRHRLDLRSDAKDYLRLTAACERAKCALATDPRAVIEVSHAGLTMPLGISRDEFDQITADLLERARDITEFLFESSNVAPDDLDEILLVGGGTKAPAVAEMMTELCGRRVIAPPDPQKAVAEGAAVYAAAVGLRDGLFEPSDELRHRLEGITLRDVNAHSLGIALDDPRGQPFSRNHILIPRNTALPAVVKRRFVTSLANAEGIALRLVEGEAPEVTNCTVIGDWRITGLPSNLPAGAPVQVTFCCDEQRRVTLEAKELTENQVVRVERLSIDAPAQEGDRQLLAEFRLV